MSAKLYHDASATEAQVFDMIEHASNDLLAAAGELSRFPWTSSSSEFVDLATAVVAKVEELRPLAEPELLPDNVIQGPWGVA